jgi:hypothetical protein
MELVRREMRRGVEYLYVPLSCTKSSTKFRNSNFSGRTKTIIINIFCTFEKIKKLIFLLFYFFSFYFFHFLFFIYFIYFIYFCFSLLFLARDKQKI